jgi:hypothetical protein
MSPGSEVKPVVAAPEPDTGAVAARAVPPWVDPILRVLGFLLALALAGMSALFEAFLAPLFWGSIRVPLSLVAAIVGNLALVWFAYTVTGRRLAAAGPALVWMVVIVAASTRTTEGDLVLASNNWVGIATMIAGSIAFAAGAYRLILSGVRPRRSGPTPPGLARGAAKG